MEYSLNSLAEKIRAYAGLVRKNPIEHVFKELVLNNQIGVAPLNFGDDAAAIPWKDGFLLLAADGIMTKLVINEPYAAGKASVMVTVNDIYSMGGRPLGMVNVLASGDEEHRNKIVQGIRRGCEKLQVPMLGGHLHPDASPDSPALAVAILGWAEKVLHGYTAQAGDDLILAVDLDGQVGCHSVTSWDANSGKTPEQLIHRLECLPVISENGWANAAKDISNAGIVGTASIMIENSGKGAEIFIDAIPTPSQIALPEWLFSFQSFGFILSVPQVQSGNVLRLFRERNIDAAKVGKVIEERKITIIQGDASEQLFDFATDKITGIVYNPDVI
jgi:uncharacterized protein